MRTLFHLWLHPFSRKVRLAMGEKGLEFELRIERIWERRTEFLAMNPAGDVPVLIEDDGTTLANSQVI
ncbi:MAG TPA: glutathione S-transferase N-terminal domain-containing protein, partial [Alphaproteobacteria bacterium]|nr:glutathione S-transferase N-terminal domain-containing protein [Alphaproteobacteria bacterium]